MTMTAVLLLVLVVCVLYLALRVRALESAVSTLARIVNKPRRRDRAIRKEIEELESKLEQMDDAIAHGYLADTNDFNRADEIREKLDRRLRALAPRQTAPPVPEPPPDPPRAGL